MLFSLAYGCDAILFGILSFLRRAQGLSHPQILRDRYGLADCCRLYRWYYVQRINAAVQASPR
jgi:hypothetical protein